jgi:nucleotide-binding universal stress UspA family protein
MSAPHAGFSNSPRPCETLPEGEVNILVAVDGSESALHAVDAMSPRLWWFKRSPRIHLLTVESRTPLDVAIAGMVSADAIRAHQQTNAEAALHEARTRLRAAGHNVVEHVAIGDPAREIDRVAKSRHCDLIVMGTRGRGAVAGLVLGSTATKVLHLAAVPVLLVPKGNLQ